ncbi:MAG: hypothetical protein HYZ28_20270 [Myxococcales bacterium]|nr:hypothetical protein [Myxococcales bacterium]
MSRRVVWWLLALLSGCSGSCGGCGSLEPIPGGRFVGPKVDSALTTRLTAGGYGVLNDNWQTILSRFAPGNQLAVPLSCEVRNFTLVGNVVVADEGTAGCTSESCGLMDGRCDGWDQPITIPIQFTRLAFAPKAPDQLEATIDLSLSTGKIHVDTQSRNHYLCAFTAPLKCSFDYASARASPPENRMRVAVKLVIDQRWDKLLSFSVASVGGSQTCGSSGASPPPECLDTADLLVQAEGSCATCNAADWGPVKSYLLGKLADALKAEIQKSIDSQSCERCGDGGACPSIPGAQGVCGPEGLCLTADAGTCVPKVLGLEGRLPLSKLGGAFESDPSAAMDIHLAAGGSATSDTGTTVAARGGALELSVAECVKPLPAPPIVGVPAAPLDADAPDGGYDVGMALSRQYLDHTFHRAHQAGAMCVSLTTAEVAQLNSGLFKVLLPSLGKLTGPADVPMLVALRPAQPPTALFGAGKVDANGKLVEPLVVVSVKDLSIDVYAALDERFARLFTLTMDITLPMGVGLEGCATLAPSLGSLQGAVTNVRASNSEILAEDLSQLEKLVPMLVAAGEGQVGTSLAKMSLPPFGDFQLKLEAAKGIGQIPGTARYEHLGIYARLLMSTAVCP